MIIAGRSTKLGQPEIRVGIMPGAGGTQHLLCTIGKYRASKMVLTGEPVAAPDALAMGLLSEMIEDGRALSRALELAKTIAAYAPTSGPGHQGGYASRPRRAVEPRRLLWSAKPSLSCSTAPTKRRHERIPGEAEALVQGMLKLPEISSRLQRGRTCCLKFRPKPARAMWTSNDSYCVRHV